MHSLNAMSDKYAPGIAERSTLHLRVHGKVSSCNLRPSNQPAIRTQDAGAGNQEW